MADCVFCGIAGGHIPATTVRQDRDTVAFRDLNPQAPTHILVIPRRHIASVADTDRSDTGVLGAVLADCGRSRCCRGAGSIGLPTGHQSRRRRWAVRRSPARPPLGWSPDDVAARVDSAVQRVCSVGRSQGNHGLFSVGRNEYRGGSLPRLPAIASRRWLPIVAAVVGGLVLVAAATTILTLDIGTDRPALLAGEVAETTILAPRRTTYVSQVQTRALRAEAAGQVGDYSDYDANLLRRLRTNATEALSAVSDVRKVGDTSTAERQRRIALLIPNLPARIVALMAELPDADWLAVTAETSRILDNHVGQRIHEDELADVHGQAVAAINQSLSSDQIAVVSALVREYIQENLIYNAVATEQARQQARDAVQPVTATVELSEVIVRAGETLTEDDIEALKALGLSRRTLRLELLLGTALYVGLLVGLFLYYVSIFQPATFSHPLQLTGVLASIVIPLFVTKLVLPTTHWAVYAIPSGHRGDGPQQLARPPVGLRVVCCNGVAPGTAL